MSRHFNTKHSRNKSRYARENKASNADRYGKWDQGKQVSPDRIAGRAKMWPVEKEEK